MTLRLEMAGEARSSALRARSYAHQAIRGRNMGEFRFWIGEALSRWRQYQALRVRAA